MLAIRMQRTGRKGHAQFRLVVQDARRTPTSGNIVAQLGHYDPHAKTAVLDKEKAAFYLEHGAQPSPRVISILKSEKITLPKWVVVAGKKSSAIRNTDKLRRNRPAEEKTAPAETKATTGESVEPTATEEAVTHLTDEVASVSEPVQAEEAATANTDVDSTPTEAADQTSAEPVAEDASDK